ncbi:MAG: hypothetical protein JOZ75_00210 [Candidatus Dormibacteraeota bacterium]|nr:hypothetical protein [Candidatus Dormibacteraeota bacterium]
MRRHSRAQLGLMRGCCALVVVGVVVVAAAIFLAVRATAAPDLGAAPSGPDDGDGQTAIAVRLAAELVPQLLLNANGTVTLSEQDLTVLANEHGAGGLSGATVRARNGQLVVSGQHPFGPFTVTPVAHLSVALDTTGSPPKLTTQVEQFEVGQLGVPGFVRDRMLGSLSSSVDLGQVFGGTPALQALEGNIECAAVVDGDSGSQAGLRIGVHRPGAAANTAVCTS